MLIGSEYGATTFTLIPLSGFERLSHARELQSSNDTTELWNVKLGDSFNFSGLEGISEARVTTDGYYSNGTFIPTSSSLYILGFPPINILHSANSVPFNFSIGISGTFETIPIYTPQNETNSSAPSEVVLGSISESHCNAPLASSIPSPSSVTGSNSVPLNSLSQSHSSAPFASGVPSPSSITGSNSVQFGLQSFSHSSTHYPPMFPSASSAPFSMSASPSNILLPAAQPAENIGGSAAGLALGAAAIAGISAGGFVVVAAIGAVGYFVYRWAKSSHNSKTIVPINEDTAAADLANPTTPELLHTNPMQQNELGGHYESVLGENSGVTLVHAI